MAILPFQSLARNQLRDMIEVVCISMEVLVFLCVVLDVEVLSPELGQFIQVRQTFSRNRYLLLSPVDGAVFISFSSFLLEMIRYYN